MKESENKMKKAVDALERNLSQIRAGRANPAILDRVTVEYYGAFILIMTERLFV